MRFACRFLMRETGDGPGLNPGRLDDVQSQALLAIYLVSIVASLTAVELVAGIPVALTKTAKPPPMAGRKQEVLQLRE